MKRILALILALGMIAALMIAAAPAMAAGPNLLVNGGFEEGNVGFSTEYRYLDPANTGTWTLGPEYMYTVSTNPSLYHSQWTSFTAHEGSKMMIVNGTWDAYTPGYDAIVWEETVDIGCSKTFTLYGGQTWDIGDVIVSTNTEGQVCVKFVMNDDTGAITGGWRITEAHVDVAPTAADVPQKNGNPQPGQFDEIRYFAPGVVDTGWICVEYPWEAGVPLVVAAHVKLEKPGLLGPESMTGWGKGKDFSGKNWATYIEYTPCSRSFLLTFCAGNSYYGSAAYPAEPAILEVQINGTVVGTLELEYTYPTAPSPGWMQFNKTWDAPDGVTSANIEIRDTRHIMYGDDFVLDDIVFCRQ